MSSTPKYKSGGHGFGMKVHSAYTRERMVSGSDIPQYDGDESHAMWSTSFDITTKFQNPRTGQHSI